MGRQNGVVKHLRALLTWGGHRQATHLSYLAPCFVIVLQLCRAIHQGIPRPAHGAGVFAVLAERIPGT